MLDEVLGLGPLERLLRDQTVADILINSPREAYVERGGVLEEVAVHFRDDEHLLQIIERIAARVGRRIDDSSPMLDARLPDGSRVNAVIPPLALKGPSLSIRRFGTRPLDARRLPTRFKAARRRRWRYFLEGGRSWPKLNVIVSGGANRLG